MGPLCQPPPLPSPRLRGHWGRGSRRAVNDSSLGLTLFSHTWTRHSGGFSHKTPSNSRSLTTAARRWESSWWPALAGELTAIDGCWGPESHFSLRKGIGRLHIPQWMTWMCAQQTGLSRLFLKIQAKNESSYKLRAEWWCDQIVSSVAHLFYYHGRWALCRCCLCVGVGAPIDTLHNSSLY